MGRRPHCRSAAAAASPCRWSHWSPAPAGRRCGRWPGRPSGACRPGTRLENGKRWREVEEVALFRCPPRSSRRSFLSLRFFTWKDVKGTATCHVLRQDDGPRRDVDGRGGGEVVVEAGRGVVSGERGRGRACGWPARLPLGRAGRACHRRPARQGRAADHVRACRHRQGGQGGQGGVEGHKMNEEASLADDRGSERERFSLRRSFSIFSRRRAALIPSCTARMRRSAPCLLLLLACCLVAADEKSHKVRERGKKNTDHRRARFSTSPSFS